MSKAPSRHLRAAQKELIKLLAEIGAHRHRQGEVFAAFVTLAACACSAGQREDEYLAEIQRWEPPEQKRFPEAFALLVDAMHSEPYVDILGPVHMELSSLASQQWGGEFYTPQELCKLIARMTMNPLEVPEDRPIEILEPACGAGAMILSCAEVLTEAGYSPRNMRATAVDVSRLAANMTFINCTLSGIPAQVIHGNSISLEQWGGWRTIFWNMAHGTGQAQRPARRECSIPEDQRQTIIETVHATLDKRGQYQIQL